MTTPLIKGLVTRHGFAEVDEKTVDEFLSANKHSVLFFPGDAERLVESDDVAVVLPEILKTCGKGIAPAVVAKSAERALQRRYRFNAFPTLVFLRGAGYLGVLSRVLDWSDYLTEIPALLAAEVTEPPAFQFPDGCYSNGMAREGDNHSHGDPQ